MTPRALRFARFDAVNTLLEQGWMIAIPNAPMHHHYYGIELKWVCPCPIPGGFRVDHRVPSTPHQGTADERSAGGA